MADTANPNPRDAAPIDLAWANAPRITYADPVLRATTLVASLRRRIRIGTQKRSDYEAEGNTGAVDVVSEMLVNLGEQLEQAENELHVAQRGLLDLAAELGGARAPTGVSGARGSRAAERSDAHPSRPWDTTPRVRSAGSSAHLVVQP
jgi:hypothetical protein